MARIKPDITFGHHSAGRRSPGAFGACGAAVNKGVTKLRASGAPLLRRLFSISTLDFHVHWLRFPSIFDANTTVWSRGVQTLHFPLYVSPAGRLLHPGETLVSAQQQLPEPSFSLGISLFRLQNLQIPLKFDYSAASRVIGCEGTLAKP